MCDVMHSLLLLCSVCTLSEEEIGAIHEQCAEIKSEGNTAFSAQDYEVAVEKYSVRPQTDVISIHRTCSNFRLTLCIQQILNLLKTSNLPPDDVILCNRSASYLALKR